jgi:uncharacterized protein YkwD
LIRYYFARRFSFFLGMCISISIIPQTIYASQSWNTHDRKPKPMEVQNGEPARVSANTKPTASDFAAAILEYTNAERENASLMPFQISPALKWLASRHSSNICNIKELRHESSRFPDGWQKFPERLKKAGIDTGAENIAYHSLLKNPREWARLVVDGWMRSEVHRQNILDPRFRHIGIGTVFCDNAIIYVTQIFSESQGRLEEKR